MVRGGGQRIGSQFGSDTLFSLFPLPFLFRKSFYAPVANVATYVWDTVASAATRVKDTTANVVTYPATKLKNTVDEALVKVGEITETATEDFPFAAFSWLTLL